MLSVDWLKRALSLIASHSNCLLCSLTSTTWNVGMGIILQYSVIPGHYHVPSRERDPVMCAAVCDWSGSSLSPPLTAILNTRLCSAFNINKRSRQAGGRAAVSYTHTHIYTHRVTHTAWLEISSLHLPGMTGCGNYVSVRVCAVCWVKNDNGVIFKCHISRMGNEKYF